MSKKSFSVIIRAIVKKCLKTLAFGRWMYPFFQKCWRSIVIPMRQKRLQKYGADCLRRLHETLTSNGIVYHCDYGTLLGFIRDNGFIPHDDDVDITIPVCAQKTPQEVLKVLLANGYQYLHGFEYDGRLGEFTVIDKTDISIDVFFAEAMANTTETVYGFQPIWRTDYAYPSENANTLIRYVFKTPTSITTMNVCGAIVSVPENADEVIASEYGQEWKTPDSKFNTVNDRIHEVLPGYAFRLTQEEFLRK